MSAIPNVTPEMDRMSPARLRSFVMPREHGAWGILLVPLVTGAWIGHPSADRIAALVSFAVAALALFCLRTPAEAYLETSPLRAQTPSERKAIFYSAAFYGSIAVVALGILFRKAQPYGLLLIGAAAGASFAVQARLRQLGRGTRLLAQLVGSLGLTSTAAAAYYLAAGRLDKNAIVLWAANWLFAVNQIHFVQFRIRGARSASAREELARGQGFLLGQALTALLLLAAWRGGFMPGLALAAFAPVFLRGTLWLFSPPAPLEIHRLGVSELVHALVFGVLLILGFQLGIG